MERGDLRVVYKERAAGYGDWSDEGQRDASEVSSPGRCVCGTSLLTERILGDAEECFSFKSK